MVQKIIDYLKRVQAEMQKVAWPTRKDLANSTLVVLVLCAAITAFLGVVDYVLYIVVTRILGL
jgi:preprotein translocase SecE subunit